MPETAPAQPARQRRPVGRRSRLSDEIIVGLSERIAAGNTIKNSCDSMGVHESVLRRWRARGQAEIERLDEHPDAIPHTIEAPYRALSAAITQAMAQCEAGRIVHILEAGRPHEVVVRVETTRSVVLQRRDAQGNRQDEMHQVTDVRTERRTEWDWRAAAWWLEHARPEFWGKARLDVTVTDERADGAEREGDITERSTALLDELARRRSERRTGTES